MVSSFGFNKNKTIARHYKLSGKLFGLSAATVPAKQKNGDQTIAALFSE
jgi:hypothetical protein